MADYAAKGHDLVKKAEKKLNSFGLFGGFGNKYEDAAEMLEKAGNQFKLAKACEDLFYLMKLLPSPMLVLHGCHWARKLRGSPLKEPVHAGGEAGQAFEKLAQVHLKQDSRLEAASSYVEAAKCYQKTSKTGAGCLSLHFSHVRRLQSGNLRTL